MSEGKFNYSHYNQKPIEVQCYVRGQWLTFDANVMKKILHMSLA